VVTEVSVRGELEFGDTVAFRWGNSEVHGTVAEVYGLATRRRVVVALDPETSGYVVDEATTVVLPIDAVRKVVAA
jgi:hypothetical protein